MPKVGYQNQSKNEYKRKISFKPFLWAILFLAILSLDYRNPSPTIIYDKATVSADIDSILNQKLNSNKYRFLKSSRYLSFDQENELISQNPFIEKISIEQTLIGFSWNLKVTLVKPTFRFEGSKVKGYLSKDGVLLGDIYVNPSADGLITITDGNVTYDPKVGQKILSRKQLELISRIDSKFEDLKLPNLSGASLSSSDPFEIVFREGDYNIRTSTEHDINTTLASLQAILEQLDKEGTTPKEYIDLRVAGKAYIK